MHGARRTFRMCSTPGCTLNDFHAGAHSNEVVERKQKRKACVLVDSNEHPSTVCYDACGIGGYGGMCKIGQREMFVYAARETRAPVMYLDGPDAALTALLISRGLPTYQLVPVNNRANVAQNIERICPGVKCKVDNICNIAKNADCCEYGVVWFDMCGVDFGTFEVSDLVHCAVTKFYTLSSRQLLACEQQAALCSKLVASHEKIIEQTLYTGLSGRVMNMVFVVSKNNGISRRFVAEKRGDSTPRQEVRIGTVVEIPLSYWNDQSFLGMYDYKVFGDVRKGSLMGAVHSRVSNSESDYRLTFQCNDGTTMLCSNKYHRSVINSYIV